MIGEYGDGEGDVIVEYWRGREEGVLMWGKELEGEEEGKGKEEEEGKKVGGGMEVGKEEGEEEEEG